MDLSEESTDGQMALLLAACLVGIPSGTFLGWLADKMPVTFPPATVEVFIGIVVIFLVYSVLNMLRFGDDLEPLKYNKQAALCFAVLVAILIAGLDFTSGYFEGSYGILGIYLGALLAQTAALNFGALFHLAPRPLDWKDVGSVLVLTAIGFLWTFCFKLNAGWTHQDLAEAMFIALGLMAFGGIQLVVTIYRRLVR
jgi:hypothetical protein